MRRGYAHRVDANQAEIFDAWDRAGVQYHDTSHHGEGFPDALVKHKRTGELRLVEIKDGSKPPSARKLTPSEERFKAAWGTVVVNNVVEALEAAGVSVERE